MKNYRIEKEESPPPSDSQVNRHKNFGRIEANYNRAQKAIHKRPLYRDPKAFLGLLVIGLIIWLLFRQVNNEESEGGTSSPPDTVEAY